MTPQDDPTINSIRKTRHAISAACEHDPEALVRYYLELQQNYRKHLITSEELFQRDQAGQAIKAVYEGMRAKYGEMPDSVELIREDREG